MTRTQRSVIRLVSVLLVFVILTDLRLQPAFGQLPAALAAERLAQFARWGFQFIVDYLVSKQIDRALGEGALAELRRVEAEFNRELQRIAGQLSTPRGTADQQRLERRVEELRISLTQAQRQVAAFEAALKLPVRPTDEQLKTVVEPMIQGIRAELTGSVNEILKLLSGQQTEIDALRRDVEQLNKRLDEALSGGTSRRGGVSTPERRAAGDVGLVKENQLFRVAVHDAVITTSTRRITAAVPDAWLEFQFAGIREVLPPGQYAFVVRMDFESRSSGPIPKVRISKNDFLLTNRRTGRRYDPSYMGAQSDSANVGQISCVFMVPDGVGDFVLRFRGAGGALEFGMALVD